MHKRIALGIAASVASAAMAQDGNAFKVYGFMDVNASKDDYQDNNFLAAQGYVNPNIQMNLNHLNTYFDWKAGEKVRVLAELSLNRDSKPLILAGTRPHADSAAIFASVFPQIHTSTNKDIAHARDSLYNLIDLGVANSPLATAPQAYRQRYVDSMRTVADAGIAMQTVSQIVSKVNANAVAGSTKPKDNGISLPRVHADLSINDLFSLRVGKWITPAGIWNVDHGSPTILTIAQPNQTSFIPIFPESQTGVQAFGRTSAGDHDLSYNAWISTGRGVNVQGLDDYAQAPKTIKDWAIGGHAQTDLSFGSSSLRLGATGYTGTLRGSSSWVDVGVVGYDIATDKVVTTGLENSSNAIESGYYMRDRIYGLDTKFRWNGLLLQGEWNHRKVLNLQDNDKETDFNAYYALVGYEIPLAQQLNVTPYAMHERISWKHGSNNPALEVASFPMKGWTIYMLGLNFGIWGNVHLKTEWSHNIIDANHVSDAYSETFNSYNSDDLTVERYSAQLSVSF